MLSKILSLPLSFLPCISSFFSISFLFSICLLWVLFFFSKWRVGLLCRENVYGYERNGLQNDRNVESGEEQLFSCYLLLCFLFLFIIYYQELYVKWWTRAFQSSFKVTILYIFHFYFTIWGVKREKLGSGNVGAVWKLTHSYYYFYYFIYFYFIYFY